MTMKHILSGVILMLCVLFFTACDRHEYTKADCVGKWVCETDSAKYFVLNADGTVEFHNMCYKDVEYPEELTADNKNDASLPPSEAQRRLAAYKCSPIAEKQQWSYYTESYFGFQEIDISFEMNRSDETGQTLWPIHNMVDMEDGTLVLKIRMNYMWGEPDMFYNVRYKKEPSGGVTKP